jgi:DNA-binding transcriptional LysR family regulator
MDEYTRIKTFLKVVQAGSFSATARDVSSISTVARQVKVLEDARGVQLLHRATRGLSLTEAGRLLYERASVIDGKLSAAETEIRSLHDEVKGLLRVSLRVGPGTTTILPALPRLLARYPDLALKVTLSDEKASLLANHIDVAVWQGAPEVQDIVARRLSPSRRIACASRAYLETRGTPQTPQELREHNCLVYSAPPYRGSWRFTRDGKTADVEVKGTVTSDNSMVLLTGAVAGIGIIIVQEWMVGPLVRSGSLQRILRAWAVSPRPGDADLYAIYASSRGVSRKVRVFVDFLKDLFGPASKGDLP